MRRIVLSKFKFLLAFLSIFVLCVFAFAQEDVFSQFGITLRGPKGWTIRNQNVKALSSQIQLIVTFLGTITFPRIEISAARLEGESIDLQSVAETYIERIRRSYGNLAHTYSISKESLQSTTLNGLECIRAPYTKIGLMVAIDYSNRAGSTETRMAKGEYYFLLKDNLVVLVDVCAFEEEFSNWESVFNEAISTLRIE